MNVPKLTVAARQRILDQIQVCEAMDGEQDAADLTMLLACHDRVHELTKGVETGIDTKALGLATHIAGKRRFFQQPKAGDVQVRFDTGIILTGPKALFDTMTLHLEEADPK